MTQSDYARLKGCKTTRYCKEIKSLGYSFNRASGSHMIFTAPNKPTLSIPNHDTISPGVWRNLGKLLNLA